MSSRSVSLCSLLLTLSRVSVHLIRLTVPSSDAAVRLLRQLAASNKNKRRAAREPPQAVKCIVGWMSKGVTLSVWERKSCIWSLFEHVACIKDTYNKHDLCLTDRTVRLERKKKNLWKLWFLKSGNSWDNHGNSQCDFLLQQGSSYFIRNPADRQLVAQQNNNKIIII